ncbi:hypothetical protein T459_22856 [Capsicum annuum]|uniref:DUF1985 domain-containing protein n=1 Tax=Capsicum annuum TaxID=4072 RepID=A0A2G2YR24_CAPAN|nr:hypothetical protein T459_22856 [Capsicum annuum]
MHVFVKKNILRFFIFELFLITDLKYNGNVKDFIYDDSSPSRLMQRYFSQSTNDVDKETLVELFLRQNFDKRENTLQMTILYFIHKFIYSQLNVAPVSFSDFKIVKDGKYELFPWVKVAFFKLMASLRQEFLVKNQLYRLGEIPQCSYSNLIPIVEELEKHDLLPVSIALYHPGTSLMPSLSNVISVQMDYKVNEPTITTEYDSFEDFITTFPQYLKKKSINESGTVSAPQLKKKKNCSRKNQRQ